MPPINALRTTIRRRQRLTRCRVLFDLSNTATIRSEEWRIATFCLACEALIVLFRHNGEVWATEVKKSVP